MDEQRRAQRVRSADRFASRAEGRSCATARARLSGAARAVVPVGLWLALVATLAAGSGAAAAEPPKLLMLPIVVHSAEDPNYLRAGLGDMLASRFERLGALRLEREVDAARGTTDPDEAIALARARGADYVLFGSFTRFGQGASLDVHCAPVSPAAGGSERPTLREIFVHSGSIGEIIPDLDELAGKVSRFARGELVPTGVPAAIASGGRGAGGGAGAARLEALTERVEALEAMLTELLERESAVGAAGTTDVR